MSTIIFAHHRLRRNMMLWVLCATALLRQPAHGQSPSFSQYKVDLGPPAADGAEALDFLPARVAAVTHWNACGRELEFLRDARDNQVGEGLLSAVMGEVGWAETHSQSEVCTQRVRFFLDDLAGQFTKGEPWQAGLQPDVAYINEEFRKTFDPNTLPFGGIPTGNAIHSSRPRRW